MTEVELEERLPMNPEARHAKLHFRRRQTFAQSVATMCPTPRALKLELEEFKATKTQKIRALLVELSGTAVFVLFGGLSLHNRTGGVIAQADIVSIALAHGLTIAIMVASAGHISGGHFNPAVTLGCYLSGAATFLQMLLYWLAQLLGGYIGGLVIRACVKEVAYVSFAGGTLNMNSEFTTVGPACVLEIVMTFFLVITVLLMAVDPILPNPFAPWAIGFSIVVDVFAGGTVTGASMNPARSFGPLLAYESLFATINCTSFEQQSSVRGVYATCVEPATLWSTHWIAWVGPMCGAILAALSYRLSFASPHKSWIYSDELEE